MVTVFQDDKGNEYYCLVTDFTIRKYFPKHQLDTIREQYRSKVQNTSVLIKALALMKEEYYSMIKSRKKAGIAENGI